MALQVSAYGSSWQCIRNKMVVAGSGLTKAFSFQSNGLLCHRIRADLYVNMIKCNENHIFVSILILLLVLPFQTMCEFSTNASYIFTIKMHQAFIPQIVLQMGLVNANGKGSL